MCRCCVLGQQHHIQYLGGKIIDHGGAEAVASAPAYVLPVVRVHSFLTWEEGLRDRVLHQCCLPSVTRHTSDSSRGLAWRRLMQIIAAVAHLQIPQSRLDCIQACLAIHQHIWLHSLDVMPIPSISFSPSTCKHSQRRFRFGTPDRDAAVLSCQLAPLGWPESV